MKIGRLKNAANNSLLRIWTSGPRYLKLDASNLDALGVAIQHDCVTLVLT